MHEREKQYMEVLHGLGHTVGEYVGKGLGDTSPNDDGEMESEDAEGEYTEREGDVDDAEPDANDRQEEPEQ